MLIGIDVDLTLVDSGTAWWEWLERLYGPANKTIAKPSNGTMYYDLSKYWPDSPKENIIGPFDFWSDPFLYDFLKPEEGAIEVMKDLVGRGHKLAFISVCKKGHLASKSRFLKRWTSDFMDLDDHSQGHGFYATHFKGNVAVDVIIDDRHEYLNQFASRPEVIKILKDTPYEQFEELKVSVDYTTHSWYKIGKFLEGI